jgi:NADPH2:quinone reductase
MRAIEIFQVKGPAEGLRIVERPDPEVNPYTGEPGVVIEVEAAGVSFPEVLQSWGKYQVQPDLPFVPGSEVAGVVRSAPPGSEVSPGDKVMAFCILGGFAEVAIAPPYMTFALPEGFDFFQGAGFPVNYHTAWFGLVMRGRMVAGDWVLVHGAAGGLGVAAIQVAAAAGARTVAVVSTEEKERVAREAGATEVVRSDGDWLGESKELSGGGVDIVFDPVGGDRFTDSLRSLRERGRVVVAGFAGGEIPTVRVHRLLHNNLEVIGAGWGAYMVPKPEAVRDAAVALERLREAGPLVPPIGGRFPFEEAGRALEMIEGRQATGKLVLQVGSGD